MTAENEAQWAAVLADLAGELGRICTELDHCGYPPERMRRVLGFVECVNRTIGRGPGRARAVGALVVEGGQWYRRAVALAARLPQLRPEYVQVLERLEELAPKKERGKWWVLRS